MLSLLEGLSDLIELLTHPRFYGAVLIGIGIAVALWYWIPQGDLRILLVGMAGLAGVVLGIVWERGQ